MYRTNDASGILLYFFLLLHNYKNLANKILAKLSRGTVMNQYASGLLIHEHV